MALNTSGMSASAQAYYAKTQAEKQKSIQQSQTAQAQQAHYNSAMSTPKPTPTPSYSSSPSSSSSSSSSSYNAPSTPTTPTPSNGYKTHYLESGGSVVVRPDGTIDQYGGTLNDNQLGALNKTGTAGDFNSLLDQEYAAGKIKNSFDFIPGQGTQWATGANSYSPFAVDLQTAARNAGQIPNQVNQPSSVVSGASYNASATPQTYTGAYGSNVANFDPNNEQDVRLAEAGQQWAAAKARGDTAGMAAAAKLGEEIRASIQGASYDSARGISTLPQQRQQPESNMSSTPSGYTSQPFGQLNPNQIQQEASYTMAKDRSDLVTATDKQSTALRDNAEYASKLLNDTRALEDFRQSNSVNPFTQGKQTWDKGLIGRQRSIDDTYLAKGLTNELNAIQQDLYNFDKLAPDRQRMLINEMTRIERDYGIAVGTLMGEFNGQRTLAGSAQDWQQSPDNPSNINMSLNNKIKELELSNLPEEIKLSLESLRQEVATGELTHQEAEIKLKELQDPNSYTNQVKALELKMAELEAANLPETQRLELQKLRKQIADIGAVHYKPQTQAEKDYDEAQVRKINAEIAKIESGTGTAETPATVKVDAKTSTDNYSLILEDVDSGVDKATAKLLLQANKGSLSDSDYSRMSKYIDDNL